MELPCSPPCDLANSFWHCARVDASALCHHLTVGIALDKLDPKMKIQQASERFTRHGAGDHIAPDHDIVNFGRCNISEYGLKCWKVPVDIIDCGNTHDTP